MSTKFSEKRAIGSLIWFIIFQFVNTSVGAWEIDRFHSGMTTSELTVKLKMLGISDFVIAPVSGHEAVEILQPRWQKNNIHFMFCKDRLFEYSKDFDGSGFHEFVQEVERETTKRGVPIVQILERKGVALLLTRWDENDEYFKMTFQSDTSQRLSFDKAYGDRSIENGCRDVTANE